MLPGILFATLWFIIFLALQIMCLRLFVIRNRSAVTLRLLILVAMCHVASVIALAGGDAGLKDSFGFNSALSVVCGLVLLACYFVLYMPFFYVIHTSLSVNTLVMLRNAGTEGSEEQELRRVFASRAFVESRLHTMLSNGYLDQLPDGRWSLRPRAVTLARFFRAVGRFWQLESSG